MDKKRIGITILLSVLLLTMLAVYVYAAAPVITVSSITPGNNSIIAGTQILSITTDEPGAANISNITYTIMNFTGGNITSNFSNSSVQSHNFTWITSNGSFPYGSYNITIRAHNITELSDYVTISNVTVDNLVPNVTSVSPSSNTNQSGNINISANVTDNSPFRNVSFSVINSSGGVIYNVTSTTGSGNMRSFLWATLNNVTFPDGVYNISINATDTVNNSNYSVNTISNLTVDNTAPVVTVSTPGTRLNYTSSNVTTINMTVTDVTTAVVSVTFLIFNSSGNLTDTLTSTKNSSNYTATLNFSNTTIYTDGVYNLSVNASDTLNNLNYNTSVLNFTVDNTAPVVSVQTGSPVNYANVTGASVLINLSITDATTAVINLTLVIVGPTQTITVPTDRTGGNFSFTWVTNNGTYLNGTTYNISIVANDTLGNTLTNTSVLHLTVDNDLPIITPNTPVNTANLSGTKVLNVTATDVGSAVSTVKFGIVNSTGLIHGNAWLTASQSGSTWNVSWATNNGSYPDGTYNVSVNATDVAGNLKSNLSTIVGVVVDNTLPSIGTPTSTASTTVIAFTVTWNSSTEVTNVTFNYGGSSISMPSLSTSNTFTANHTVTINTGLERSKIYYYNITGCDNAGNCNTTGPFNITTNFIYEASGGGTSDTVGASASSVTYSGLSTVGATVERVITAVGEKVTLANLPGSLGTHTVTYNSANVADQTVTVTVASTPKTLTVGVGESQKVDLNDDNTYDLSVTLSSFTSATNFKLKFEVLNSKELVVPTPITPATSAETTTPATGDTKDTTTVPSTTSTDTTTAPAPTTPESTSGGLGGGVWALIIIVVLLVLWFGWKWAGGSKRK